MPETWDEKGNPVGAQIQSSWDEHGNSIPQVNNEAEASANPLVAKFDIPRSSSEMIGEGEEAQARGNADLGRNYVHAGPMEVAGGVRDISQGNIAHGIHRAVVGAGVTAAPAAINALPIAAMTSPFATAGSLALGTIGQPLGKKGGQALGLTDDQSDVAGDVVSGIGALGGGKAGNVLDTIASKYEYRPPNSIRLPWGLGKIASKAEPDYPRPPLPMRAYAEMQKDFAKRREGIDPNTFAAPDPDIPSSVAGSKGRMVLTPEESRIRQRMQPMWQQRASERGMIFAGGGVPEEGRSVPMRPTKSGIDEFSGSRGKIAFDKDGNPLGKIKAP